MQIPFTKMQGAGNDFVVLDETRTRYGLTPAHYRWLADRHFGVGADQILSVRPPPTDDVDFAYVIHNADGGEVEHCGNGARCFYQFVRQQGLTDKARVRVQTQNRVLELMAQPDGRVTVDMQAPDFEPAHLPFAALGLQPVPLDLWQMWPLSPVKYAPEATLNVALVSMGNPHAVCRVDDVVTAEVAAIGAQVQALAHFPRSVNVGFMQVNSRSQVALRVFERGAGETLACGTGACAAVVAGIRLGWLDPTVDVHTHGGLLTVAWAGGAAPVLLTGPASIVFHGTLELPEHL
jgi:diaminopimelate epimerase